MEGSVSSLIVESLESNGRGDVLSAEDLAWVDSCLIKDPEISDSNWNALKDALIEIVNFQPAAISDSSSGNDGLSKGTDIEMHIPSEEAETVESGKIYNDVQMNVGSEINNDSHPINQKTSTPLSKISEGSDTRETFLLNPFRSIYKEGKRVSEAIDLGLDLDPLAVESEPLSEDTREIFLLNPFQPTYKEGKRVSETIDLGFVLDPLAVESEPLSEDTRETFVGNPFRPTYKEGGRVSEAIHLGPDLDSLGVEIKPLSEEIFKVWELGVPDEGDEFLTQLNKALAETSLESIQPSSSDDSGTWKDMKDESIDNLIAGIADLSLDQNS